MRVTASSQQATPGALHTLQGELTSPHTWHADLRLRFAHRDARTALIERQHVGPLVVQRPFYPDADPGCCHVYVVHPPGGIAGGDRLHLHATIQEHAQVLLTTPAATKFYRAAAGKFATLDQHLQVHQASLEWLPQETIFFDQAQVQTRTRIMADARSRVLAWEQCIYGRPASAERYTQGQIRQQFELWIDGRPLLLDHLRIHGGTDMQHAAWGLAGHHAMGSLLAYPATVDDLQAVRALALAEQVLSCTLIDGALWCRCLGSDAALIKQLLFTLWQTLRPRILARPASAPRIWAT